MIIVVENTYEGNNLKLYYRIESLDELEKWILDGYNDTKVLIVYLIFVYKAIVQFIFSMLESYGSKSKYSIF